MAMYRQAYDKVFIPKEKGFVYNGISICDLSIFFLYSVFDDETGGEILGVCKDGEKLEEKYFGGHPLNDFYKCSYDRHSENGYMMTPTEIAKTGKYHVKHSVYKCYASTDSCKPPMEITHEELCNILRNNPEQFDCSNNESAQNLAWKAVIMTSAECIEGLES